MFAMFFFVGALWADDVSFCDARRQADFGQTHLMQIENNLGFRNRGGLANGGVCWWHSRFTRNAAYVAQFRPDLAKPSRGEALNLIHAIRLGQRVVMVPGYSDLQTFAVDFEDEIQKKLEAWQRYDGFSRGQWRRGLAGRSTTTAAGLERSMDKLYERILDGEVVYQKLQLRGIVAHAWLVLAMTPFDGGYELTVWDSNYLTPQRHVYRQGMTHLTYNGTQFVPYTEYWVEFERLQRVAREHCTQTTSRR